MGSYLGKGLIIASKILGILVIYKEMGWGGGGSIKIVQMTSESQSPSKTYNVL